MQFVEQPIEDNPFVALIFTPDGQTLCIPCVNISTSFEGNIVSFLDFRGNPLVQIPESIPYVLLYSSLIEESEEEDTLPPGEASFGKYL